MAAVDSLGQAKNRSELDKLERTHNNFLNKAMVAVQSWKGF